MGYILRAEDFVLLIYHVQCTVLGKAGWGGGVDDNEARVLWFEAIDI